MDNYEKKYKQLHTFISDLYPHMSEYCKEKVDGFFKEGEDELTWLTKYIEEEIYSLSIDIRDNEDRIKLKKLRKSLAWLEKQSEKPQRMVSAEAKEAMYGKHTWDEEDEKIFNRIIRKLDESDNVSHYDYADFEIWLIDLKERLINI